MTNINSLRDAAWRTSSYSTSGNQCVQVAPLQGGNVAVRDSKSPETGIHIVSRRAWAAFITAIKAGESEEPSLRNTGPEPTQQARLP